MTPLFFRTKERQKRIAKLKKKKKLDRRKKKGLKKGESLAEN